MVAREDVQQKKQERLEASVAARRPWKLRQLFAVLMRKTVLCSLFDKNERKA